MRRRNRIGLGSPKVQKALLEMGVTDVDMSQVRSAASQEEGTKRLGAIKDKCKKGFRKKAHELHPDRTNDDPEKTEHFKWLREVYEGLQQSTFRYRGQRSSATPRVHVVYQQNGRPKEDPFATYRAINIDDLMHQMARDNFEEILKRRNRDRSDIADRIRRESEKFQKRAEADARRKRADQAREMRDRMDRMNREMSRDQTSPADKSVEDAFKDSLHEVCEWGNDAKG